jgi:hypothetical protein
LKSLLQLQEGYDIAKFDASQAKVLRGQMLASKIAKTNISALADDFWSLRESSDPVFAQGREVLMKNLVEAIRKSGGDQTEEAMQGMRRAFHDSLIRALTTTERQPSGDPVFKGDHFTRWLDSPGNERALNWILLGKEKVTFGPEEAKVARFKQIAETLTSLGITPPGQGVELKPKGFNGLLAAMQTMAARLASNIAGKTMGGQLQQANIAAQGAKRVGGTLATRHFNEFLFELTQNKALFAESMRMADDPAHLDALVKHMSKPIPVGQKQSLLKKTIDFIKYPRTFAFLYNWLSESAQEAEDYYAERGEIPPPPAPQGAVANGSL